MSTIVQSRARQQPLTLQPTEGEEPGLFEEFGARAELYVDEAPEGVEYRRAKGYEPLIEALRAKGVSDDAMKSRADVWGFEIPGTDAWDYDKIWGLARDHQLGDMKESREAYDAHVSSRAGYNDRRRKVERGGRWWLDLPLGVAQSFQPEYGPLPALGLPSKTIWGAAAKEGAINLLIEGLEIGRTADARATLGNPITGAEMVERGAIAFGGGALFGAAGKAIEMKLPGAIDSVRTRFEQVVTDNWEKLPAGLRKKWATPADVPDSALPDVFEAVVGRDHMSVDERAALAGLRREADIDAANPYIRGLESDDLHRQSFASAMRSITDAVEARRAERPPRAVAAVPRARPDAIGDTAIGSRTVRVPGKPGQIGYASDVYQYFRAKGLSEAQARGIAAGIHAESRSDHAVRGGYKGRAVGLGQWLGPRRAKLIARYGENPTRRQQLDFMWEELQGGDPGGRAVLAATDEKAVLDAYIRKFMRPAEGAETTGDLQRGMQALGRGGEDIRVEGEAAARGGDVDPEAVVTADLARRRAELDVDQARLDAEKAAGRGVADDADGPVWVDRAEGWIDDVEIMAMPELRRDQFPDEASWRTAQAEVDAAALGVPARALLPVDEVVERSAGLRAKAAVADVDRRLEVVAERSGFELRELRDNFKAWKARDGEAAAIDLLSAKETELGIAPPARTADGATPPAALPDDLAPLAVPIGVDADGTHSSGFFKFEGPNGVFSWHPETGHANGAIHSRTGITADDVRAAIADVGRPIDVEEVATRAGWDDAADRSAVETADSVVHDLDALHGIDGDEVGFYLGEDGDPVRWAAIREELDLEESEIANIRGCL